MRYPYVEAVCRLNTRFPILRPLWHKLWRIALARALERASN